MGTRSLTEPAMKIRTLHLTLRLILRQEVKYDVAVQKLGVRCCWEAASQARLNRTLALAVTGGTMHILLLDQSHTPPHQGSSCTYTNGANTQSTKASQP